MKILLRHTVVTFLLLPQLVFADSVVNISQKVWLEFSNNEKATIISKFPNIEIVPSESVGTILSAQTVNRSSQGTTSGAELGSALGQSLYIDNAFKGDANYSATHQLGAALLGAALGSTVDSVPQIRYIFNYGIKTLDGHIREVKIGSPDEFTKPIGQCVYYPVISVAPADLCNMDKSQFLRKLSAISQAPKDAIISQESTGINVNCRIPGVGLMTVEKNICIQMEGVTEK